METKLVSISQGTAINGQTLSLIHLLASGATNITKLPRAETLTGQKPARNQCAIA
jgi:hypothetical protein